ncbi:MAG: hypothetical protein Q7T04_06610 [Dehalococcoidia bacterium]|nr:hypothetical protein [Dehalococcoidia bacterium]
MNAVIPAISSLVSLVFAVLVLDQYMARRKPHQLVWALGLGMYFVSTGTEFLTEVGGLNPATYRLWYLFGAVFVAAYLGMGTAYLLLPRRIAHTIMALLVIASVYAAVQVAAASIDWSQLPKSGPVLTGKALPQSVRLITPFFNVFGTVALVGGALYSCWVFIRRHILCHRVVSNILIAVGAIMPAVGGTASRLEQFNLIYVLELVGIVVIFAGFLRSNEVFGAARMPVVHWFDRKA